LSRESLHRFDERPLGQPCHESASCLPDLGDDTNSALPGWGGALLAVGSVGYVSASGWRLDVGSWVLGPGSWVLGLRGRSEIATPRRLAGTLGLLTASFRSHMMLQGTGSQATLLAGEF
jgi:hypothetical protein